jgi:hypothetical protein
MSTQVTVNSIEALKDFRVALALYGEDTLAALGAVNAEVRRTIQWLHQDRPAYWQQQVKIRRERVAAAQAELFRRKLAKTPEYSPPMSEQKEILRRAELSLQDAEKRSVMVRKWQPMLQQAVLEAQASTRRLRDLAAGDIPRAVGLLDRLIDALEAYLRVAVPSSSEAASTAPSMAVVAEVDFDRLATPILEEELAREPEPIPAPESDDELLGFEPTA